LDVVVALVTDIRNGNSHPKRIKFVATLAANNTNFPQIIQPETKKRWIYELVEQTENRK
jgi:hypothetical protein